MINMVTSDDAMSIGAGDGVSMEANAMGGFWERMEKCWSQPLGSQASTSQHHHHLLDRSMMGDVAKLHIFA